MLQARAWGGFPSWHFASVSKRFQVPVPLLLKMISFQPFDAVSTMPGCQNSPIWWSQLLISFGKIESWALLSATDSYWAPFSQSSWGDAPHKAAAVRGKISFQAPVQKKAEGGGFCGELSPQMAILMDGWVNSYCSNNQLDESQTKVLNQDHHSSHGYAVRQS